MPRRHAPCPTRQAAVEDTAGLRLHDTSGKPGKRTQEEMVRARKAMRSRYCGFRLKPAGYSETKPASVPI
jgi:hypothetical protein